MRRLLLFAQSIIFCGLLAAQSPLPPIGQWREHLSYRSVCDLAAFENTLLAGTPYSFFSYEYNDQAIERYSQVNGLSATGVNLLHPLNNSRQWLVVYQNNQLDLLSESNIRTVYDIVNSNQIPDGGIYSVLENGDRVYLCTQIGILVLDAERAEIRETWRIGNNGIDTPVYALVRLGDSLFAATGEGLKSAFVNEPNLADFARWQPGDPSSGLPAGEVEWIELLNNQLLLQQGQQFLIRSGQQWLPFYSSALTVNSASVWENQLFLCLQSGAQSFLRRLSSSGSPLPDLQPPGGRQHLKDALQWQNQIWLADSLNGVWQYDGSSFELIVPSSPAAPALGKMRSFGTTLLAAGAASSYPDYWFKFTPSGWESYSTADYGLTAGISNIRDLAHDPISNRVWVASDGGGLIRWEADGPAQVYQQNLLDPGNRLSALALDPEQRLWMAQPGSATPLLMLDAAGNNFRFAPPFAFNAANISDMIIDSRGWLWLCAGQSGLLVYDPGADRSGSQDDRWRQILFNPGNGNLSGQQVLSVLADRQGIIWVGTNDGIALLECADAVFDNSACEAIRPVVQTGNFAGFLFANETVSSIVADGANRKWVGTGTAAWQVSAAGDSVLVSWNNSNSPLPQQGANSITIVPSSGEIFFSGAGGIVSWRGTATEAAEEAGSIEIFPNPVPPGYTGRIGIRGLVENSIVTITELNGRLVSRIRSLGGQAVWDGRDLAGRKLSSGVYLVLAADEGQKEKAVGKIIFIQR